MRPQKFPDIPVSLEEMWIYYNFGNNQKSHLASLVVAIPFYSTIFPAALAANSPEYLVLPEPL